MDNGVEVPCGHCIGCRIKRTRDWAIRCTHELQMTGKGMFLTLTYAPERLPEDGSVDPGTLTSFIKTLRQRALRQSQTTGIRYFACGEYGENLSRPHYHLCIFGHSFEDMYPWSRSKKGEIQYRSDELEQCWRLGHSTIGELNQQSAGYTARYVMKKVNGKNQEEHYQGRHPEFVKASNRPGIGRSWIERYLYDVYPDDFVVMPNGKRYSPPRFYDKFLEEFDPDLFAQVKERRIAKGKEGLKKTIQEVGWQGVGKRLDQRHDFKTRQLKQLRRSYESEGV